jgi:hypothetical protein
MQDSSHLTIILCSSVIKIVISQKQKCNRKNNFDFIIYNFSNRNSTAISFYLKILELENIGG